MKKPYNFSDLMNWIRQSWEKLQWIGPTDILNNSTYPKISEFFSEFMTTRRRENGDDQLDELIQLAILVGIEQGKLIAQKYTKAAMLDLAKHLSESNETSLIDAIFREFFE